jgi:hypothetical protein
MSPGFRCAVAVSPTTRLTSGMALQLRLESNLSVDGSSWRGLRVALVAVVAGSGRWLIGRLGSRVVVSARLRRFGRVTVRPVVDTRRLGGLVDTSRVGQGPAALGRIWVGEPAVGVRPCPVRRVEFATAWRMQPRESVSRPISSVGAVSTTALNQRLAASWTSPATRLLSLSGVAVKALGSFAGCRVQTDHERPGGPNHPDRPDLAV